MPSTCFSWRLAFSLSLGGPGAFLTGNVGVIYASIVVLGIGSWLHILALLPSPMELPGMTPEKVAIVWGFIITVSGFCASLFPLLARSLGDIYGSFTPGFIICGVAVYTLLLAGIVMPRDMPKHAGPLSQYGKHQD